MKIIQVFMTAFKLGCTSFGGPIAHLSYFHDEYVTKKNGSVHMPMLIWWPFANFYLDLPVARWGWQLDYREQAS